MRWEDEPCTFRTFCAWPWSATPWSVVDQHLDTSTEPFTLRFPRDAFNVFEVVCEISAAFSHGADEVFPHAKVTFYWFHVVKLLTDAVDCVRRLEAKHEQMPHGSRFAVLTNSIPPRTARQEAALQELAERGLCTATGYRVKELLRWVRQTDTAVKARCSWRYSANMSGRSRKTSLCCVPSRKP